MRNLLTILLPTVFLLGCASPSRQAHSAIDETTITVRVLPVDQTRYEMVAAIERRAEARSSRKAERAEHDRFNFPKLIATLDGGAAELIIPGVEPSLGPRARFKVRKESGKVVADYRVGYVDRNKSYFTEGLIEVEHK